MNLNSLYNHIRQDFGWF